MTKIRRESVAREPWGEAYLREMDLVIASNIIEALRLGKTLYNDMLNLAVAERCLDLDGGYREERLDIVDVPENAEAPYKALPDAQAFLKELPRGHWAVFRKDGKYEAYMSDGFGGLGVQSGLNFTSNSAYSKAFDPVQLYSHVVSYMVYERRYELLQEIIEFSCAQATVTPGDTFANVYLKGKTYPKMEFLGMDQSGESSGYLVKATRRGVRPIYVTLDASSFHSLARLDTILPPEYDDPDNAHRLSSELRATAAAPALGRAPGI